jgi:hypothetical protein
VPFFPIYCSDRTLEYWCPAPSDFLSFNIDIPENYNSAISRNLFVCTLFVTVSWMITEVMSWRAAQVCIMLSHVHSVPAKAYLPHFPKALHFLFCCWLWKMELVLQARALRRCTILSCQHSYRVSFIRFGGFLLDQGRLSATLAGTNWHCRWFCLSGVCVAPCGRTCTLDPSINSRI